MDYVHPLEETHEHGEHTEHEEHEAEYDEHIFTSLKNYQNFLPLVFHLNLKHYNLFL